MNPRMLPATLTPEDVEIWLRVDPLPRVKCEGYVLYDSWWGAAQMADRRDGDFMYQTMCSGVLVIETLREDGPGDNYRRQWVNWGWWRKEQP